MFDALLFELNAFQELMFYINSVTTEICGIGRIAEDQFGIHRVTNIEILPQIAGAADANVTADDMAKFFGNLPEGTSNKEWYFNFHTHPKFATNPSATDITNYTNLSSIFNSFVPMIFNQLGQYTGWVYFSNPVKVVSEIKNIWIYEWREDYNTFGKNLTKENQINFINMIIKMNKSELTPEHKGILRAIVDENVTAKTYYSSYQQSQNNYHHYNHSWQRTQYGLVTTDEKKTVKVEKENPEFVEDYLAQVDLADQSFFEQAAGMETGDKTLGDERYFVNPHNWPLLDIIEEMKDLGFEYGFNGRALPNPGHIFEGEDWETKEQITMSLQDAKNFLLSVLFRTEEKSA